MQKQHYFVRNFGRNYSFCESLPDLAFVSRLVRCVMQDGGRELIYLYGSHTSYWSNVGVEIATAYLYCYVPRDEVDGGKFGGSWNLKAFNETNFS